MHSTSFRRSSLKLATVDTRKMVLVTLCALVFSVGVFSTSSFAAIPAIAGPTFHVLPQKGNVNRNVNVSGTGWIPLATVTVKFDSKVVATASANSTGGWSGSFKVPETAAGAHTVTASDGTNKKSHTFTVLPHLTVKPKKGIPGATITLLGTGFAPGSTVKITFNGIQVKRLTTNSTGGFPVNTTFTVPNDALASYPVVAKDGKGNMANSTFTIT
jgi:hypothetical protein